jgi:hypothetical protein
MVKRRSRMMRMIGVLKRNQSKDFMEGKLLRERKYKREGEKEGI